MDFSRLTKRERTLAIAVVGVVLVLINLFAITFLLKRQSALRVDFATRTGEWKMLQTVLSEQKQWEKRNAWLDAKQPKLASESSDRIKFFGEVQRVAEANKIALENQAFGNLAKTPFYQSIPVNLETKSSWEALIAFLHELQQPGKFIVFENVDIQIEPSDPTKMRGKFRIANWFAPAPK